MLTARDLGRVLPSAWQQRVKMGARQPYRRFLATVRRGEGDQKFWRYQDVARDPRLLVRRHPGGRAHLVVVPPSGAPREELWLRTAPSSAWTSRPRDRGQRPNDSLAWWRPSCCAASTRASPAPQRSPPSPASSRAPSSRAAGRGGRADAFAVPERHRLGRGAVRAEASPPCVPARTTSWATSTTCCPRCRAGTHPRRGRRRRAARRRAGGAGAARCRPGRLPRRGRRPRRGTTCSRGSARDEGPVVEVEQHAGGVLAVLAAQRHRLVAALRGHEAQPQRADARGVDRALSSTSDHA